MAKNNRWMPTDVGDYLADTMHLTYCQHGVYLLLLFQYWKTGPLPDDDVTLASIVKADIRIWKKSLAPVIRPFFSRHADGLLHQKRMDAEHGLKTGKGSAFVEPKAEQKQAQMQEQLLEQKQEQVLSKSSAKATTRARRDLNLNQGRRELTTPPDSTELARSHGNARTPRIGDPPEAWASLAETWSEDRGGVRRATRNGDFVDLTAEFTVDAARLNPETFRQDWAPLIAWMDAGIDGEDIITAVREVAAAKTYDPARVKSLAYFDRAVRARKASAA
jgi:uncharacterized protein YdaU (DUF1376 family)